MDTYAAWIVLLSVATPVAGVVGFAIQLRNVKKTRLENDKLQLEIASLKAAAEKRDSRIVMATTEEVLKISRRDIPSFSRRGTAYDEESIATDRRSAVGGYLIASIVILVLVLVFMYAAYDIYRAIKWLST